MSPAVMQPHYKFLMSLDALQQPNPMFTVFAEGLRKSLLFFMIITMLNINNLSMIGLWALKDTCMSMGITSLSLLAALMPTLLIVMRMQGENLNLLLVPIKVVALLKKRFVSLKSSIKLSGKQKTIS